MEEISGNTAREGTWNISGKCSILGRVFRVLEIQTNTCGIQSQNVRDNTALCEEQAKPFALTDFSLNPVSNISLCDLD